MICKNCHTSFDADRVNPGERVYCPKCGKVYIRRLASSKPEVQKASPPQASPVKTTKKRRKNPVGLIATLCVIIALSLAVITGILLHRFAPEAFRKVTFGVFAKEEKTPSGDTYVLKSYTYIHCDRAGNDQNVITTEYRYFANGLLQEEHLSADDSPDT